MAVYTTKVDVCEAVSDYKVNKSMYNMNELSHKCHFASQFPEFPHIYERKYLFCWYNKNSHILE